MANLSNPPGARIGSERGCSSVLTVAQHRAFFLDPEPPDWCIEMEKWPYHKPAWKQWLADKRAGKQVELPID